MIYYRSFETISNVMANPELSVIVESPSPGVLELGSVYLRIGNLTFGGGAATVAALQRELVSARR